MLNLSKLKNVSLPQYSKEDLKAGILHIGIGAFNRAHQIYYIDKLLNNGDKDALNWGYVSGTIRSNKKLINNLKDNNFYYTLSTNDKNGYKYSIIGALKNAYFAGNSQTEELINNIANNNIKIITYTITEKGYYVDLSNQKLNINHPEIKLDLENIEKPKTAIAITVAGLRKRFQTHKQAITLLSCDNMPNNGTILKESILTFAKNIDVELAKWINDNCTFPNCMVDRIVPAVTMEVIENTEKATTQKDITCIATEEFTQWVIEDNFANGRPNLEKVGVEFVNNIEAYEKLKLSMLNGSHSLIAYLGAYAGLKTVDEVINIPEFNKFIKAYMLQISPLIKGLPNNISTVDYAKKLLIRFANPYLKHRTEQIAMDGSKKIPQRWLENLQELLNNNQDTSIISIGLAGWILFCSQIDENNQRLKVNDPLLNKFIEIYDKSKTDEEIVNNFFALKEVFSNEFNLNQKLKNQVVEYIKQIRLNGVLKVINNIGN